MSLERIIKTLEGFRLKRTEAEVYVYLAKKGPLRAEELAAALKLSKQKICLILRKLQNKGIVKSKNAALFSAMAIEEVLELYIKVNVEQAQEIKETKEELLASWSSIGKRGKT